MGAFGESKKERMLRLYDTHAHTVWRICRLYLSDAEAEDAVHDVFLKLLSRLKIPSERRPSSRCLN